MMYVLLLVAATCLAVHPVKPLSRRQDAVLAAILFLPTFYYVDHHAHGTLLVGWVFKKLKKNA